MADTVPADHHNLYRARMVGATRIELATSRPPDVRAAAAPSPDYLILSRLIALFIYSAIFR